VDFARWLEDMDVDRLETARRLGLAPRTLRNWLHDDDGGDLVICCRGRPMEQSLPSERHDVLACLNRVGPGLGLPTLQTWFPRLARAELHRLLESFRRDWIARHPHWVHVLHWKKPGIVWAMDFSQVPRPIDGLYEYVLAVRDLGSGQQLAWLPVEHMDSTTTIAALDRLFTIHGQPLVLKSDNGSPFIAGETQDFLATRKVQPLFSPPGCPAYNAPVKRPSVGSRNGQPSLRPLGAIRTIGQPRTPRPPSATPTEPCGPGVVMAQTATKSGSNAPRSAQQHASPSPPRLTQN
jgi:hypothetical protein